MNDEKIYQFRNLDLALLSALAVISECLSSGLLKVWNSDFYFSFSVAICLIAMIRWGAVGVIVGIIGGMPGMLFSDMAPLSGLFFYAAANAALAIPALLYGNRNRSRIAESWIFLGIYVIFCHVCLAAGKGVVIFFITGEWTGMIDFFGTTFLVFIVDVIVCLVLRMREGLICDMRYYFKQEGGEPDEES